MSSITSSATPFAPFAPVDTSSAAPLVKDEVESPSISSTNALARFEFEAGRGREGTKILMVEWEDDETTRGQRGDWHIEWEGKTTVLPAKDQSANDVNRMYFLLAPGVQVPASVMLTHRPDDNTRAPVVWHTNPLPAIFPPELGVSPRAIGKKGILHTIWAKKRLQVLLKEIEAESKINAEGIGLQMAVQEKEWIESTFGVHAKPQGLTIVAEPPNLSGGGGGPVSPRTPGGGRLMEKLRGLKLGTSEKELSGRPLSAGTPDADTIQPASNPLSPESSDVAVSSFSAFKGENPSTLAVKPPQLPHPQSSAAGAGAGAGPRKMAAVLPPSTVTQQQGPGMASLNAFAAPAVAHVPVFESRTGTSSVPDDDVDDGLFALPISPRSPEMTKSPFSFGGSDTAKYLKRESAGA